MVDVEIRDNMIRLGQFVKLAGAVESGAMAKEAIAEGEVCCQRGRQLHEGDVVSVDGAFSPSGASEDYRVVCC